MPHDSIDEWLEPRGSKQRGHAVSLVTATVAGHLIARTEAIGMGRHAYHDMAAGVEPPDPASERGLVILDVLEHLECNQHVEAAIRIVGHRLVANVSLSEACQTRCSFGV